MPSRMSPRYGPVLPRRTRNGAKRRSGSLSKRRHALEGLAPSAIRYPLSGASRARYTSDGDFALITAKILPGGWWSGSFQATNQVIGNTHTLFGSSGGTCDHLQGRCNNFRVIFQGWIKPCQTDAGHNKSCSSNQIWATPKGSTSRALVTTHSANAANRGRRGWKRTGTSLTSRTRCRPHPLQPGGPQRRGSHGFHRPIRLTKHARNIQWRDQCGGAKNVNEHLRHQRRNRRYQVQRGRKCPYGCWQHSFDQLQHRLLVFGRVRKGGLGSACGARTTVWRYPGNARRGTRPSCTNRQARSESPPRWAKKTTKIEFGGGFIKAQ